MAENHEEIAKNNKVGLWEPIRIETLAAFKTLNLPNDQHKHALPNLADWHVFEKLGAVRGQINVGKVHNAACKYAPDNEATTGYQSILKEQLDPSTFSKVMKLIAESEQERIKEATTTVAGVQGTVAVLPPQETLPKPPPPKRQKLNPDEAVTCSQNFHSIAMSTKNLTEKILAYRAAVDEVKEQVMNEKKLVSPLKEFAHRAAKCLDCVGKCHGGNIQAASSATGRDRVAVLRFEVQLSDPQQLERVIAEARRIDGVFAGYSEIRRHRHGGNDRAQARR